MMSHYFNHGTRTPTMDVAYLNPPGSGGKMDRHEQKFLFVTHRWYSRFIQARKSCEVWYAQGHAGAGRWWHRIRRPVARVARPTGGTDDHQPITATKVKAMQDEQNKKVNEILAKRDEEIVGQMIDWAHVQSCKAPISSV